MSERAHELAERFEQASREFFAAVEGISEAHWLALTSEEGRTVAALVHHVAWAYDVEITSIQAIADDQPLPIWTWETLHQANAENAERYADAGKSEILALLRSEATKTVAIVRGLSAEQLTRAGIFIEELGAGTVDEWIEYMLIEHPGSHLTAIRDAVAAQR